MRAVCFAGLEIVLGGVFVVGFGGADKAFVGIEIFFEIFRVGRGIAVAAVDLAKSLVGVAESDAAFALVRGAVGGGGDAGGLAAEALAGDSGTNGEGNDLGLMMVPGLLDGSMLGGTRRVAGRLVPGAAQHAADEREQIPQRLAELLRGVVHARAADGKGKDLQHLRVRQSATLAQHDGANHGAEVFGEGRGGVHPFGEVEDVFRRAVAQAGGGEELL